MTPQSKAANIEAIVLQHFPFKPLIEAMERIPQIRELQAASDATAGAIKDNDMWAQIESLRSRLNSMTAEEVAQEAEAGRKRQQAAAAKQKAEREATQRAQEKAKEDARFYNQAAAIADFVYWCKADYWTLDEAVALLLGREPRVVTPAALQAELKQPTGFLGLGEPPKRAKFHSEYDGLRQLMVRAENLGAPRLKPRAVLDWAQRTATPIPTKLVDALTAFETAMNGSSDGMGAAVKPQPVAETSHRKGQKWSPEALAELQAYKAKHGPKAASKKYGISEARVRVLAPTREATPTTRHPLDAWSHRSR